MIWRRRRSWRCGHGRSHTAARRACGPGCAQLPGVKPGTRNGPGSGVAHAKWAGDVEQIAAAPSPESAVVTRALATLPLEQRAALVLCLIHEFSHAEAAGI